MNADAAKKSALPSGVLPRGLSRVQAAAYIGISPVTLDRLVKDGLMPKPVRIYGRVVWDARAIDSAFDALDSGAVEDQDGAVWSKAAV